MEGRPSPTDKMFGPSRLGLVSPVWSRKRSNRPAGIDPRGADLGVGGGAGYRTHPRAGGRGERGKTKRKGFDRAVNLRYNTDFVGLAPPSNHGKTRAK